MTSANEAGAKACLSDWMARLIAVERPREPVDVDMLKSIADTMPMQPQSVGDFVREMRDADRH